MPKRSSRSKKKDPGDDIPKIEEALERIEAAQGTRATRLDLSRLGLTAVPRVLGRLTALEELNVSDNNLTVLPPEIAQLTALKELYLSNNNLTVLPPEIAQLTALKTLDVNENKLTALPPEVGQLTALKRLYIGYNELTTLPPEVGQLTALTQLIIAANPLAELPSEFRQLSALSKLHVHQVRLDLWWPHILRLESLIGLYAANAGIREVPSEIGELTDLRDLFLGRNELKTLPPEIGNLRRLETLWLDGNRLATLPREITQLPSLTGLYLHGNPGLNIPEDVLGAKYGVRVKDEKAKPKSPKEILDYYFRTRGLTKRPLNEAKLILVGRGGAGKTSLRKRLLLGVWDEQEDKTPGIQVTPWPLTVRGEQVTLNVWDFGGQEIMHATHQFFLTKRSLYVLVLNSREGEQDANVEYWLRLIAGYGGGSPALVVINKCEQHPLDLDERGLKEKFPFIRGFLRTDCATKAGLAELRAAIERETAALPDLRTPFPEAWFGLKRKLGELRGDCITTDEYRELCRAEKEKDRGNQDVLIGFLHDLGAVLHFGDDHRLSHLGVLKPAWVTQGIYGLLNADMLKAANGVLNAAQLDLLLDPRSYPHERHGFLLQLMEKFELCFELPETERTSFLIPELLPKETPELPEWKETEALRFEYHYNILPEGLLPRFIVRTHALSEGQKRWRSGVVLRQGGALALVRADVQERLVTITVRGPGRQGRDLLAVMRGHFEEIHRGIAGLSAEEKVPVPGYPRVKLDYRKLLVREANGKRTVEFETESESIELPLAKLLDNFEGRASRQDRATFIVKGDLIAGDKTMKNINIGGDNYGQVGETLMNCTNVIQQQRPGERRELLEKLEGEVKALISKLPGGKQEEASRDFEQLLKGATSATPNRRWYSVSAEGLLEASKFAKDFAGNLAGTIGQLGKLTWPDFSLPAGEEEKE